MDDDTVLTFFGKAGEFIPNEPKKDVCWNYANCKEIIIKDKKKGYRQCSICKGYVCPRCGNCHCTNPNLKGEVRLERKKREAREKLHSPLSLEDIEIKKIREDFERVFRLFTGTTNWQCVRLLDFYRQSLTIYIDQIADIEQENELSLPVCLSICKQYFTMCISNIEAIEKENGFSFPDTEI